MDVIPAQASFPIDRSGFAHATPGSLAFLERGGEMGRRMRAFDWSTTPLGPPQTWPQSLRTAIRILLDSRWHSRRHGRCSTIAGRR